MEEVAMYPAVSSATTSTVCWPFAIQINWFTALFGVYKIARPSTYTRTVKIGSGGVAVATSGTGELTLAPVPGLDIVRGKPQRAAGGGSCAGGTMVRSAGGAGVTGQSATFLGKPWHPANPSSNPA